MHVALSIQQGDCPASALNEQFDSGAFAGGLAGISLLLSP